MTADLDDAEREAWRAAVTDGMCPLCQRGPFRVVAIHMSLAHEIDRFQLRDKIGVMLNSSICDPAYAEECSQREKAANQAGKPMPSVKGKKVPRRRLSTAGRDVMVATVAAGQEKRLKAMAEQRQRRIDAHAAGATVEAIAATEGVAVATIVDFLRSSGVDIPDRRQRPERPDVHFDCAACGEPASKSADSIKSRNRRAERLGIEVAPLTCSQSCAAKLRCEGVDPEHWSTIGSAGCAARWDSRPT